MSGRVFFRRWLSQRLQMLLRTVAYVARHPYSSLRLLSLPRLKKFVRIVFFGDEGAATEWVHSRFPEHEIISRTPILFSPGPELDAFTLTFPVFDQVDVSIIVPVFNEYAATVSCLQALLAHTPGVNYEVIVADDASEDLTRSIGARIHNIRVVRAERNQGFIRNCNAAAASARGRYLLLLNNDTNVQPDWLPPLLALLENEPQVAVAGPKLLFPDGRLQEAGGIVWQDGSAWNFGFGQNPDRAEYNYVHDTDYVSGACLLIRRAVWEQLSGFDEDYCPAYYEDTDLAFRVRAAGWRVVYQPASEVVHFLGVTNGTDARTGIKQYQVVNQSRFRQRWQQELDKNHFANGKGVFVARDRSRHQSCVLIIDHYVPFYDKDAGSRSTFLYIKAMRALGLNVKFMPANFFPHQPYTRALQQLGVEVLTGEHYARHWQAWLRTHARYIDVIYMHRPHITEDFIGVVRKLVPRPRLIYFGHDLHYLRKQREAALTGNQALLTEARRWQQRERAIFGQVDRIYYPSAVEVAAVAAQVKNTPVRAIPLYLLDSAALPAYRHGERSGILFIGGFNHPPNEDAILWFAAEVMPLLLPLQPELVLHVVGSNMPDAVQALASSRIQVHGFLSDAELTDLYRQIRLAVVPLRYGAGVKGKVLEAIQAGVPVVTTTIGAEGIPAAEQVLAVADTPTALAETIDRLYRGAAECEHRVAGYAAFIDQYFSLPVVQTLIQQDFVVEKGQ